VEPVDLVSGVSEQLFHALIGGLVGAVVIGQAGKPSSHVDYWKSVE